MLGFFLASVREDWLNVPYPGWAEENKKDDAMVRDMSALLI
jgi:hypothetical protein